MPSPEELAKARECVGMELVHFDAENFTLQFERPGVRIDLGTIGKGFALEIAAELLRDAGVTSALIHGGTCSVCAIGSPPGEAFWKMAIVHPNADVPEHERLVAVAKLRDESFSVSAGWSKAFEKDGVSTGMCWIRAVADRRKTPCWLRCRCSVEQLPTPGQPRCLSRESRGRLRLAKRLVVLARCSCCRMMRQDSGWPTTVLSRR